MDYKVVVTRDAEEDLESFIKYLVFEKENMQAAENVLTLSCNRVPMWRNIQMQAPICQCNQLPCLSAKEFCRHTEP